MLNSSSSNVVNTTIDSLYLRVLRNGFVLPSDFIYQYLDSWRKYKKDFDYSNPLEFLQEFPGLGLFRLLPVSHRPYEFVFANERIGEIRIWNPDKWASSLQTGQFYLDFRSQYLQFQGLDLPGVKEFVLSLENLFYSPEPPDYSKPRTSLGFGMVRYSNVQTVTHKLVTRTTSTQVLISRVDLATDIATSSRLGWSDLDAFTYRARKRRAYSEMADQAEILQEIFEKLCHSPMCDKGGGNTNFNSQEKISSLATLALTDVALTELEISTLKSHLEASLATASLNYLCCQKQLETVYFGTFKSDLFSRIYMKSLTLELQSKQYMREVWSANGWNGSDFVIRVEFSLTANFLKSISALEFITDDRLIDSCALLHSLDDFLKYLPSIWSYLTSSWLRHTVPGLDSHSDRWETSIFWEAVQGAYDYAFPVLRSPLPPQPDDTQIKAQALGCLLTWSALRATSDNSLDGLDSIWQEIDTLTYQNSYYSSLLLERRQILGIDDFTDTAYSRQCRQSRMLLRVGS